MCVMSFAFFFIPEITSIPHFATTTEPNSAEESMNECRPIREFKVSDVTVLDGRTKIHVSEGTTKESPVCSVVFAVIQDTDHNSKASVRNLSKQSTLPNTCTRHTVQRFVCSE